MSNEQKEQVSKEQQTQQIVDSFRVAERAMVAESVDSFYKGLVLDPIEHPNKLPEEIFVNVFLPYFRGDKNFKEASHLLGEWYAIAGSHVSEVQIVDNTGKALYNVPPYVNNRLLNPTHNVDRKEMSLHDIDGSAEAMSRNIPIQGRNFRERMLAEKVLDIATGENPDSYLARWAAIFARYDTTATKSEAGTATTQQTTTAAKGRLSEDEFDF